MVETVTSSAKARETFKLKHSAKESGNDKVLLPRDVLADGEEILYETRAKLWPIFLAPATLFLTGLFVLASSYWLSFDYINTFLMLPSTDMLLKNTIKWFGITFCAFGIVSAFIRLLRWRFTIYAATNRRFLRQTGVLSRYCIDCAIRNIQTSHLHVSMLGRIFNFGTLVVSSASTESEELRWEGISKPMDAYRKLNEIIDNFE